MDDIEKCCGFVDFNEVCYLVITFSSKVVFVEYIFLNTASVSFMRPWLIRNLGLSGNWYRQIKLIPLKILVEKR